MQANDLIIGFVLFAPATTSRQHSHLDIEESYISISGSWSENKSTVFAPGSLILNTPGSKHRITTGEIDPCLLACAWTGPNERLIALNMNFSKKWGCANVKSGQFNFGRADIDANAAKAR